MSNLKFLIDQRETLKTEIKDKIPEVELKNLLIGDYQYVLDDEIFLIIERKTMTDYASSIKDHRNREQKKRLLSNKGNAHLLYLVEGDLTQNNSSYKYNKVNKNTIVSSIINTITRDNIHVFHTSNSNETIFFLISIYEKLKKQGNSFLKTTSNHENELIEQAKIIKSDNMNPNICFQMILNCIPKISSTISKRISNKYKNLTHFIEEIKKIEEKERINYISNLKTNDTEKARKISKKACENIIVYLGI